MTGGSQQLRQFRRAIRDGASVEDAAATAGISIGEARLHAAEDVKNPPPAEAYELLGHNKGPKMADNISAEQLRLLIERVERLEEEKKGISDDIKDVYAEAKSTGFDVPTMKWAIRQRKIERHKRQEAEALQETYQLALGF